MNYYQNQFTDQTFSNTYDLEVHNSCINVNTSSHNSPKTSNDVVMQNIFVTIPHPSTQTTNHSNKYHNTSNSTSSSNGEIKSEPIKIEIYENKETTTNQTPTPPLTTAIQQPPTTIINTTSLITARPKKSVVCYKCESCPFISISQTALTKHIAQNHQEKSQTDDDGGHCKKLSCPGCENIFYNQNSLETHLINDHKMNQNEIETLVESLLDQAADQQQQKSLVSNLTVKPKAKSRIYIKNVKILQKPNLYNNNCTDLMFNTSNVGDGDGSNSGCGVVDGSIHVGVTGGGNDENVNEGGVLSTENHRLKEPMLISRDNTMESGASLIISSPCSASPTLQPMPLINTHPQTTTTIISPPKTNKIYIKNVDILKNPIYLDPITNMAVQNSTSLESVGVECGGSSSSKDLLNYEFNHLMRQYNDPGGYNNSIDLVTINDPDKIFMKCDTIPSSNGLHLRTVDELNLLNLNDVQNFINPTSHQQPPIISSTSSSPLLPISSSNHQLNDEIIIMDPMYSMQMPVNSNDPIQYTHDDDTPGPDDYNTDHYTNTYGMEYNFSQQTSDLNQLTTELQNHHNHHHHGEVEDQVQQHMSIGGGSGGGGIGIGGGQQMDVSEHHHHHSHHHSEHKLKTCDNELDDDDEICYYDHDDNGLNNEDDILFVCAEEIINETTNNRLGGSGHHHSHHQQSESNVNELLISENTFGSNQSDSAINYVSEAVALTTGHPSSQITPNDCLKKVNRGRPKGVKLTATGYTKDSDVIEYKCTHPACVLRFRSADKLEYHERCHQPTTGGTNISHTAVQIICPECSSEEYRNWNTLHTHLWRQHQIDMELFSCKLCNFKTPILSRLNNTHVKIHSNERNFKCTQCDKSFKNTKQLKNHRRIHRLQQAVAATDTIYKCVKCPMTFTKSCTLKLHCEQQHKTSAERLVVEYKCEHCGRISNSKSGHKIHVLKHNLEKKFKCDSVGCNYETNDHNAFRRHRMKHNEDKHYKCPYCKYTSIQSTTFRNHILKNHSSKASEIVFQCDLCPFVTINKIKFDVHTAKHEIEKKPNHDSLETVTTNVNLSVFQQKDLLNEPMNNCYSDDNSTNNTIDDSDDDESSHWQNMMSNNILNLEPHPVIRPAFFANNFSNVENLRHIDLSGNNVVNSSPLQTRIENHDCYNIDLT